MRTGLRIILFQLTKNVMTFVSRVNARQRAPSAEEDFNNQVDRMNHSVDTSKSLSQSTMSLSNGFMNKVSMLAEMRLCMGLEKWTSTH